MTMPVELSSQALGYQLHTNRELGMMLRGVKPLAVFSEVRGYFPPVLGRYFRLFDRHVRDQDLIRRDHIEQPLSAPGSRSSFEIHVILFTLPHEAWRIDAMIEL